MFEVYSERLKHSNNLIAQMNKGATAKWRYLHLWITLNMGASRFKLRSYDSIHGIYHLTVVCRLYQ